MGPGGCHTRAVEVQPAGVTEIQRAHRVSHDTDLVPLVFWNEIALLAAVLPFQSARYVQIREEVFGPQSSRGIGR